MDSLDYPVKPSPSHTPELKAKRTPTPYAGALSTPCATQSHSSALDAHSVQQVAIVAMPGTEYGLCNVGQGSKWKAVRERLLPSPDPDCVR
eukprot:2007835-Amphidinium_carterae.1